MSAREDLSNVVSFAEARDVECAAWVEELYRAVKDEVLREAAQKIRSEVADMDGWPEEQHVARKYADLIDPDKGQS